jgi:hypothetical protein
MVYLYFEVSDNDAKKNHTLLVEALKGLFLTGKNCEIHNKYFYTIWDASYDIIIIIIIICTFTFLLPCGAIDREYMSNST